VHAGTSIVGRRLDEPDFEPFWVAVEASDMTVFVHPMFAGEFAGVRSDKQQTVAGKWPQWKVMTGLVGFPMEVTLMAERLMVSGVLATHPKARVHLALGGGFLPYQLGRLRMFKEKGSYPELKDSPREPWAFVGQITVDTHVTDVQAVRFLIERMGVENAALGTDSPFDVSNPDPMGELRLATNNDEATIRQVAETNPARLFHVDG
jgi:predicted TIM-barrel fold metal-dependent hydrolase